MKKYFCILLTLAFLGTGSVWAQSSSDDNGGKSLKSHSHKKHSKKTSSSKKKKSSKGKKASKAKKSTPKPTPKATPGGEAKAKTDLGNGDVEIDLNGK